MLAVRGPELPDVLVIPTLRQLARRAVPQAFEAAIVPAVLFLVAEQLAGTARRHRRTARVGARCRLVAIGDPPPGAGDDDPGRGDARPPVGARLRGRKHLPLLPPARGGRPGAVDRRSSCRWWSIARWPDGSRATSAGSPPGCWPRRPVHRFFRRISVMWGLIGLGNAAVALWLLTNQSTGVFVVAKTVLSTALTAAAVAVSTLWFRRTVARDDALAGAAL